MSEVKAPEQAQKLLGHLAGYVSMRTVEVGLRTGIVQKLAEHPDGVTSETLAKELGYDPFYVSVWLRSAYGAEVLEASNDDSYRLAPHMSTLLLDPDSPMYVGGNFTLLVQPEIFDLFADKLPTGQRIWWDQTSPEWIQGVSGTGRAFYNRLIPGALEQVPGLKDKLAEGAKVLELASGAGIGLVKLANAYPSISLVGLDGDAYSIELASNRLKEAGLENRAILVLSSLEDLDAQAEFDVAIINISMHEARDIEKATQRVREALTEGGIFVISDFPFPEALGDFRTVPARIMLAIQFFEALIDDQLLPTREFVELLQRNGFKDVGSFDVTPVHAITYGTK